ncbi:MAG: oligoendopeptidase F [Clostridiales Family XIII bacterium]|jgi:oligoendopeptidase F|nr:oligoendopeptidase F [Clostridiales Family XIII bacterium]
MGKERSGIPKQYKWNIEAMYPDESLWEDDFAKALKKAEAFKQFAGRLGSDGKTLLRAFREADRVWLIAERVYVYARMKRDEDNREPRYQAFADRAQSLLSGVASALSFFTPEFLAIPGRKLAEMRRNEKGLDDYGYVMRRMLRRKAHVLSKNGENILARLGEVLGATGEIFTMINDADMKFGTIRDGENARTEVTHGNYGNLMESRDRRVRKAAYNAVYRAYAAQKNTLAATYGFNTKTDVISARIRKYESSLEAALAGDNVPAAVYDNLIAVVNEHLDILHRYMDVRRRVLGLPKLRMYDVYVPLFPPRKDRVSFEEAVTLMKEGLAPLGKTYCRRLSEGVDAGWIDVLENEGKTAGAYSFGSYDSMPYILMNYAGRLKDVFTLAHEMGHSMHSLFTRETQPFRYGGHSIFTAEVASTVNESLLMRHLAETRKEKDERKHLINMYIEAFRTTLFRQTMFAEFERLTHLAAESGEVLTAELLSSEYGRLNAKYFGARVETDAHIRMEWSRIPHFYRAFYVYQYATGYSAATAIADRILTEGKTASNDYIRFLRSGESDDPIELLKIAGVDMGKPEPIRDAMKVFGDLVSALEQLA